MKLLVLFFLVGCATANFYKALDDEAEDLYHEFMFGLEESGVVEDALGHDILLQAEDDVKTELGKKLRETLNDMLEKMKDSVDQGKELNKDLANKLKEVREKMKELKIDLGNKAKEMMKKMKDKVTDFWRDLLDKIKGDSKRSVEDPEYIDLNIKAIFKELKKAILEKIDKEKLKEKIEQIFGKGSEMGDSLLKMINEKGDKYKQKLLDLVDRFLGKDDQKRSIAEYWEKLKEYFKNLHIDLKQKYMKFGDWVKNNFKEGVNKSKSKIDNIKAIAKEFIDHTKGVSKEVAVEAKEFLRPYKEDLGSLWEQVKDAVKDIVNRES